MTHHFNSESGIMRSRLIQSVLIGASLAILYQTSFAKEKVAPVAPKPTVQAIDGSELFAREWLPNDPRSHGGDGLGPMFNDSSCVACHNQGGAGGAGPASKNVDIVTAFNNRQVQQTMQQVMQQGRAPTPNLPPAVPVQPTLPEQFFRSIFGDVDPAAQGPSSSDPLSPQRQPTFTQPGTETTEPELVPAQQLPQQSSRGQQAIPVPVPQFAPDLQPTASQPRGFEKPVAAPTEFTASGLPDIAPTQTTPDVVDPFAGPPVQASEPAPQNSNQSPLSAQERAEQLRKQREQDRKQLKQLHPGFAFSPSVVLHKSATVTGYETWRGRLSGVHFGGGLTATGEFIVPMNISHAVPQSALSPTAARGRSHFFMQQMRNQVQISRSRGRSPGGSFQHGNFAVTRSQRNTTALFGIGLIDDIPVALLEQLEKEQADATKSDPKITGRVARLKNGSAGRFGWKAQTASLGNFVMTACAVEVGLNVPDHPQAGVPQKLDYEPAGLDLNQAECDALIQYIAELPAPIQQKPLDTQAAEWVADGHRLFASVGCAKCHKEDVGQVAGIFSDLLLHDMGQLLGDTGSYGVFVPNGSPEQVPLEDLVNSGIPSQRSPGSQPVAPKIVGATRLEWRTPPLWGVRDSGPYLHDGRADTLEQAIAMHGGEAEHITKGYFALTPQERFKLISFLKTLSAPVQQVARAD